MFVSAASDFAAWLVAVAADGLPYPTAVPVLVWDPKPEISQRMIFLKQITAVSLRE